MRESESEREREHTSGEGGKMIRLKKKGRLIWVGR